jgi:hypothetical protein
MELASASQHNKGLELYHNWHLNMSGEAQSVICQSMSTQITLNVNSATAEKRIQEPNLASTDSESTLLG